GSIRNRDAERRGGRASGSHCETLLQAALESRLLRRKNLPRASDRKRIIQNGSPSLDTAGGDGVLRHSCAESISGSQSSRLAPAGSLQEVLSPGSSEDSQVMAVGEPLRQLGNDRLCLSVDYCAPARAL